MDLDSVKSEPVTREFLAVVLAGFGNELSPLTSDYGDEPCPKALLPVANKPMIEYILTWLEHSGIKDVLLICPAIHRPAIYHHIHSDVSSSSLRIDIQTVDETLESGIGTCELLRQFSGRITEDFVLVPCDFIPPPSLPLGVLLNKFRLDAISKGSIATTCWYASQKQDKGSAEDWGPQSSPLSIIWDNCTGTLLHIDTPDDIDKNQEEMEIKMTLLSRYPRTKMSSSFQDSHVYVCRRTVLDALHMKRHFDSFKEEFLPWLCKVQYQRSMREKYGMVLQPASANSQLLALKHCTLLPPSGKGGEGLLNGLDATISNPPSPMDSQNHSELSASFNIGMVVCSAGTGLAIRVNTLHNFMDISRQLLTGTSYTLPSDPKNRSLIDHKAQISSDNIIGDFTQVSERTVIKKSIIGRHCVIGKMTKIIGCVLLDHCVVGDGAKLDGCILGKNTKVGLRTELTKCVTQAGYEVSAGESIKGEKLEVSDWTAPQDESETENEKNDLADSSDEEQLLS